jgi:predicted metal-dependent hydrolase/ribosome biogenesis protein Tsr3
VDILVEYAGKRLCAVQKIEIHPMKSRREEAFMQSRLPPTIIVRHPHENPKKCSVWPLRGRSDVRFLAYPVKERPPLNDYIRLSADGPQLSEADSEKGVLLLDGSWRWAAAMTRDFQDVPPRSLHGWRTAYPRVSKLGTDPDNGLASIEALFVAYHLLGRATAGLLDHYHWAEDFLHTNSLSITPNRFVPEFALPPYSFVPGRTPHPIRDPAGHLFGQVLELPPPLDPARWRESKAYLYGIDLFNRGYYWEAHETWEGLWRAAERKGTVADFLKALIKLAAAGVKIRQGQPRGVASHARGAAELFHAIAEQLGDVPDFCGLRLRDLLSYAERIEKQAENVAADEITSVKVVLPFVLNAG